jgi:hypothetical protein
MPLCNGLDPPTLGLLIQLTTLVRVKVSHSNCFVMSSSTYIRLEIGMTWFSVTNIFRVKLCSRGANGKLFSSSLKI